MNIYMEEKQAKCNSVVKTIDEWLTKQGFDVDDGDRVYTLPEPSVVNTKFIAEDWTYAVIVFANRGKDEWAAARFQYQGRGWVETETLNS
jgi:hypothetical protein